jgi:hypothetical protein
VLTTDCFRGIVCRQQIVLGDCVLTADCVRGIVCWQQIVLGGFDKRWEGKYVEEL